MHCHLLHNSADMKAKKMSGYERNQIAGQRNIPDIYYFRGIDNKKMGLLNTLFAAVMLLGDKSGTV